MEELQSNNIFISFSWWFLDFSVPLRRLKTGELDEIIGF